MGVVITEQNLLVLRTLAKYYVLSRAMIQEYCFPHVKSARSVCERLRKLKNAGYISQASMEVVVRGQNAVPVYHPNKKTAETLAAYYGDAAYKNIFCKPPSGRLLFHWLEISKMHRVVDLAVELSNDISMPEFYNEWEPINKDALKSNQRFSLYSEIQKEPSIVCAPDAGFLIEKGDRRKVFYMEIDRGTDSIKRICSKKPRGFARLQELNLHFEHFPTATVDEFSVLFVTTTEYRRDSLLERFQDIGGNLLWKFATYSDVTPDSFFFKPVWRSVDTPPHTLVNV